jgi:hypothetical protein
MAFSIRFDYRFDSSGFFDDPARRATLEAAAAAWEELIGDDFAAIPAGASFEVSNPSVANQSQTVTLDEPIADLLVFVGARFFSGTVAAVAGPTGTNLAGDIYRARVAQDYRGTGPVTDFEPWAGQMSFDIDTDWHYGLEPPPSGKLDLYTVAIHELGHVLGIGTSGAFDALITPGAGGNPPTFDGANAVALNGGAGIPLDSGLGHVEEGFAGNSVVLDPIITTGTRLTPSEFDKAILADIGYQVPGYVAQGSTPPLATEGAETITGSDLADLIEALGGGDLVFGGTGGDTILGGAGDDQLQGEAGADSLQGGTGADLIFGGAGADWLLGDAGDDQLQGGTGDDTLSGGAGTDSLWGEGGANTFRFGLGGGHDRIYDFDLALDHLLLVESGFADTQAALDAISKPFSNVSRLTLSDGSRVDIYHNSQAGTPLDASTVTVAAAPNSPPEGLPTIIGTLAEGETLSAETGSITDADGLGPFAYLWFRDGVSTGETGASYVLGATDIGAAISLRVSYVDQRGAAESLMSAATGPIQNVNDAPQGLPQINGTLAEGETLSAETGGITDADGLGAFTYDWRRDGISTGATGETYLLTAQDIGAVLSLRVSYTDQQGTAESLTSAATAPVQNVNDAPQGLPQINGIFAEGQTLSADTSGITDADGLGPYTYDWRREGVSTGESGETYLLTAQDIGAVLSLRVSYTDSQGTAESLTSAATDPIQNVNDAPQGLPQITGSLAEGQTLSADTSGISDADGLGTFTYNWRRDGVSTGESGETYLLTADDIGAAISLRLSYTDGRGTAESVTSAATGPIQNVNDAPQGLPQITGIFAEGQTLSADTGGISDADGLGTFTYDWRRDGISTGATGETYLLTAQDIGAAISLRVSYTDQQGTAESLTSAATTPIQNVNDAPQGLPQITGTLIEGSTLSADTTAITDADGLGPFTLHWLRDGEETGATGETYLLTAEDVGAALTLRVSYTDQQGTAERVLSAATAPVALRNGAPTGEVILTGGDAVGALLSADLSQLSDPDGLTSASYLYQWLRDGEEIAGATGASYRATAADAETSLSLRLSFTDDRGSPEVVESAPLLLRPAGLFYQGDASSESFWTTAGDDTLMGAEGVDTALVAGPQASFTLTLRPEETLLQDRRSAEAGGQGTDTLFGIEQLDFEMEVPLFDGSPMDLSIFDGPASLTGEEFSEIIELYIAYFNRAPDALGLFYWATEYARGFTVPDMAANFFFQPETQGTYAAVLDGEGNLDITDLAKVGAFVTEVYGNVLGRAPDGPGFDYWTGELIHNPAITPDVFILAIIGGAKHPSTPTEQTQADQAYLATKADLGAYFAVIKGMSDVADARDAMSLFLGTEASRDAALQAMEAHHAEALDPATGDFLMPLIGVIEDPFLGL